MKIKLKILSSIILFSLLACDNNTEKVTTNEKEGKNEIIHNNSDFESKVKREIESRLKINSAENYKIKIVKEYIDRDTVIDAVILVNREEYAIDKAKKKDNLKFLEYLGYTGPHNHVFVYLGGKDKFLQAPPVGSSIKHELTVNFEIVTTPSQKDFFVEYRSKNSVYRNYYTVRNNEIYLTFNCPVYSEIGDPEPKAYDIQHLESSVRLAKDIALYNAKISNYNPSKIEDINNYTPDEIVATDELFVYFIFDDKKMVYVTPMRKEEAESDIN